MKKDLQIFENKEFGTLRTVEADGKIMFVASDVAKMLGYSNPNDAVARHCKGIVKRDTLTNGGKQALNVITEGDVYRLVAHSKLPKAEQFESWVFDEVLPTIRKTGSYSVKAEKPASDIQVKRTEAMWLNARTRQAKMWADLAKTVDNNIYKKICQSYMANTLAGEEVFELPEVTEKTYSATQVGDMLGISSVKVGMLANKGNLKVEKYGKWVHDISRYSNKEVESFRYNQEGVNEIEKLLHK